MKKIIIILALVSVTFASSKQEQIDSLNARIDTLEVAIGYLYQNQMTLAEHNRMLVDWIKSLQEYIDRKKTM